MRDYQIEKPSPEFAARRWGFMDYMDQCFFGPLNLIDRLVGTAQLATDSRSKRRRRTSGAVRFILPRSSIYTQAYVTDLLARYGVRTRHYTHDANATYFIVRASQADWAIEIVQRWQAGSLGEAWNAK